MSESATIREIHAQTGAWGAVLAAHDAAPGCLQRVVDAGGDAQMAFFRSRTSYYLSLAAAAVYRQVTGWPAQAIPPSDVLLFRDAARSRRRPPAWVFISRSGTTTETVRAARAIGKEPGTITVAITCNPRGDLQGGCGYAVVAEAAREESVVMTQSFSSMLLTTQLLAAVRAGDGGLTAELQELPALGAAMLERCEGVGRRVAMQPHQRWVYLGQGPYYGLACEGMLKVKEMSLTASEAYHTLEYRHGPKALMDRETRAIFLLSEGGKALETPMIPEVRSLGGSSLVVCETAHGVEADDVVELQSGLGDVARLCLYMPLLHLLAYHRALAKGMNPNKPKNLREVVRLPDEG